MANQIEFNVDGEGRIETTFANCIICGNKSISISSTNYNICPECTEVLESGKNCLVIEDLYHDEQKVIGGRAMILESAAIKAKSAVVVMSKKEFEHLYKIYMSKMN